MFQTTTRSLAIAATLAATLVFTTAADAAVVSYTSDLYDADADISNNGSLVFARNLGDGAVDVTHNGVTFAGGGAFFGGFPFANAGLYAGGPIGSLSSANAQLLLDTLEFGGGAGNSLAQLTGLTVGESYEVQLIYSTNGGFGATTDVGYATPSGSAVEIYPITGIATGTSPFVVTGTFTADQVTQDLHSAVAVGLNFQINAVQLRQLPPPAPEPSTLALAALSVLGLCVRRRRRFRS